MGRKKPVIRERAAIVTKSTEPSRDSDRDLVERFKEGEERAFNEIVRRHQERIFAFVFRMVHDFDDASDLAQGPLSRLTLKSQGSGATRGCTHGCTESP